MLLRRRNGQFKRNRIWEAPIEELREPTAFLTKKYRCSNSVVCSVRLTNGIRRHNKFGLGDIKGTHSLNEKMDQYEKSFRTREQNGELPNGNVRIYTAADYSQEFLKSLIPEN